MNVGTKLTKAGAFNHITTLDGVVEDFKRRYGGAGHHDVVVLFCREAPDFPTLIERAVAGRRADGKMFQMDSCIPKVAKKALGKSLMASRGLIEDILYYTKDFDQLYDLVDDRAGRGIGDLTIYNVTARIGGWKGIEPKRYVYVHCGPLAGWKALTGKRGHVVRIHMHDLPKPLQAHSPREVEDCLCEFRDFLHPGLLT